MDRGYGYASTATPPRMSVDEQRRGRGPAGGEGRRDYGGPRRRSRSRDAPQRDWRDSGFERDARDGRRDERDGGRGGQRDRGRPRSRSRERYNALPSPQSPQRYSQNAYGQQGGGLDGRGFGDRGHDAQWAAQQPPADGQWFAQRGGPQPGMAPSAQPQFALTPDALELLGRLHSQLQQQQAAPYQAYAGAPQQQQHIPAPQPPPPHGYGRDQYGYQDTPQRTAEPSYGEPRRDEPRYGDRRHSEPRYDEPRYAERRYDDRRYNEPRQNEPKYGEPRFNDAQRFAEPPRYGDQRYGEPRRPDPGYGEPRFEQPPYRGEPPQRQHSFREPAYPDPAGGGYPPPHAGGFRPAEPAEEESAFLPLLDDAIPPTSARTNSPPYHPVPGISTPPRSEPPHASPASTSASAPRAEPPRPPSPASRLEELLRLLRRRPVPAAAASQATAEVLPLLAAAYGTRLWTRGRENALVCVLVAAARHRARVEQGGWEGLDAAGLWEVEAVKLIDFAISDPPLPPVFPDDAPEPLEQGSRTSPAALAALLRPLVMVTDRRYPPNFRTLADSLSWLGRDFDLDPTDLEGIPGPSQDPLGIYAPPTPPSDPDSAAPAVPWSLPANHPTSLAPRDRWASYGVPSRELDALFAPQARQEAPQAAAPAASFLVRKRAAVPAPRPAAAASGGQPPDRPGGRPAGHADAVHSPAAGGDGRKEGLRGGTGEPGALVEAEVPAAEVPANGEQHAHAETNGVAEHADHAEEAPAVPMDVDAPGPVAAAEPEAPTADGRPHPQKPTPPKISTAGSASPPSLPTGGATPTPTPTSSVGMLRSLSKPAAAKPQAAVVELSLDDLAGLKADEGPGGRREKERREKKAAAPAAVKREKPPSRGRDPDDEGATSSEDDPDKKPTKRARAASPASDEAARRSAEERRAKAEAKRRAAEETEAQRVEREEAKRAAKREASAKRKEEKKAKDEGDRKAKEAQRTAEEVVAAMVNAVVYSIEIDERRARGEDVKTVLDEEREREAAERRREAEKEKRRLQRIKAKAKQAGEAAGAKRRIEGPLPPAKRGRPPNNYGPMPPAGSFGPPPGMYPGYHLPYGYPMPAGFPMHAPGMPPVPGVPGVAGMAMPLPQGMPGSGIPPPMYPNAYNGPGVPMPAQMQAPAASAASQLQAGDPLEGLPFLKDPSVKLSNADMDLMRDFLRGRFAAIGGAGQSDTRTVTLASFLVPEPGCDPPRSRWIKETVEFEMSFSTGMWRRSRKKRRGITLEQAMTMGLEMREHGEGALSEGLPPHGPPETRG
ncbi:hypothetical protein DFJ74DRAFT_754615, partial [Hyaloraphidium curvatum]